MPNIVTFDTDRLLIIEIPVFVDESPTPSPQNMADNVTNMFEIYSEWKEFVRGEKSSPSTGSLGFPPAIRTVAGDPVTFTQNLGVTYFVTNGWRFKPAEGNHRWTIDGNVWTDPPGQSVFVPTDGPYTVNVETKVSNLVDSTVSNLDLIQLLDAIYIDVLYGVSGTGTIGGTQIGTPSLPSNNLADARTIADNFNVRVFNVSGEIVLDRPYLDWTFEGVSIEHATVNINGRDITGSTFFRTALHGSIPLQTVSPQRKLAVRDCQIPEGFPLLNFVGTMIGTLIGDDISLAAGPCAFSYCSSEVAGSNTPKIDRQGLAGDLNIRGWIGGFELVNFSNGENCSLDIAPGHAILGPTNTNGNVVLRGHGKLTNLLGSPSVNLDKIGFIEGADVRLTRQLAQNRTHTNPSTGIMTVFDDNDVDILVQGDLFEDVAATQDYRGQGADRRNRLI